MDTVNLEMTDSELTSESELFLVMLEEERLDRAYAALAAKVSAEWLQGFQVGHRPQSIRDFRTLPHSA